jgi:hypothetical protein
MQVKTDFGSGGGRRNRSAPRQPRKTDRSVEEHRRSSFIPFGGPRAKAELSPGRQAEACPTLNKLQLVQASQARPGPQAMIAPW